MRVEKGIISNQYAARVAGKGGILIVDYQGLPSEGFNRLRRLAAGSGAGCLVVKNLIFRRLLAELGCPGLDAHFRGQTSVIYTDGELPPLVKSVLDFASATGVPRLKAAYWMGSYFDGAELARLALLPSRPELLSLVCSAFQAPLRGLVGTLDRVISGLVGTISAIRDQRVG